MGTKWLWSIATISACSMPMVRSSAKRRCVTLPPPVVRGPAGPRRSQPGLPDSQALRVLVWNETQYGQEETFTAWQVPADGSPARQVAVFKGMQYSTYLSPNSQYIAYLHRVQPTSNEHELHLAYFDGSRDVIYARGYLLQISGWSPDSIHFVYDRFGVYQPWLGSVCGAAQPLLDPAHTPASNINWVDAGRFVYTQSPPGGPGPLRMGQINGPSLLISPNDGKILHYEIK